MGDESSSELSALEQTLTNQFSLEVGQLRKLQTENDARRMVDLRKEAARSAKDAKDHKEMLENMLLMQAKDLKETADRRKFWTRFILGPSGVLAVVAGAVVAYLSATAPPTTVPEDVKKEVVVQGVAHDAKLQEIEETLLNNDAIHERMVKIQLDQQVQFIDGHDQLVELVKAPNKAARAEVKERPSVTDGRIKAKAIKDARDGKPQYDPADPLADLRKPKK